jgi:2-polyprenyl-6-methoxyphenol hydroxylase-like FAD-dependent oxidoreductase
MSQLENKPLRIVILGGGTAGWMTAIYMQHQWRNKNIEISLVESPDIGIVGVGEGSTPSLKNFFDDVEIQESDWMPRCNATYKVGIRFDGWSSETGYESYRHPFPSQLDVFSSAGLAQYCHLRRASFDVNPHPDQFFIQSYLADQKLAPIASHSFPFSNSYGYHFDSGLLGQYLSEVAVERGVSHIQNEVVDVTQDENGDFEKLIFKDSGELCADFFIDCTGFRSFLIQNKLKVPFHSFKDNLFNDSAVVLPTERSQPLRSETISTALTNGWAWDIPLTNRTGNGYVYSSDYCNEDDAETELREKLGLLDSDVEARHLKMKVGRVDKHWSHNCLAIGLSQGFIEPLEATALHIVQVTILEFMLNFESGGFTANNRDKYNQIVNARFEGVRDYIVAHYRINSRNDSQYWKDNANNQKLSDSLISLLNAWTGGLKHDIDQEILTQNINGYFPLDSWRILFSGYGFFPKQALKPVEPNPSLFDLNTHQDFIQRCALNYQMQSAQLKQ